MAAPICWTQHQEQMEKRNDSIQVPQDEQASIKRTSSAAEAINRPSSGVSREDTAFRRFITSELYDPNAARLCFKFDPLSVPDFLKLVHHVENPNGNETTHALHSQKINRGQFSINKRNSETTVFLRKLLNMEGLETEIADTIPNYLFKYVGDLIMSKSTETWGGFERHLLKFAAEHNYVKFFRFFAERFDSTDAIFLSALHEASINNSTDVIRELLDRSRYGVLSFETLSFAVRVAAHNGSQEAIELLVNYDPDWSSNLRRVARINKIEACLNRSLAKLEKNMPSPLLVVVVGIVLYGLTNYLLKELGFAL